jgi:hypothetical protein
MDRVVIGDQDFALTSDSLRLMQEAWESLQQLAMLGAVALSGTPSYILSGCEQVGNVVSSGVVVLNGEVLPFAGGAANEYVSAAEQTEVVTVGSGSYTKVLRAAQWGTGQNQIQWALLRNRRPAPKCFRELINLPTDGFANGTPSVSFNLADYLPGDFVGTAIFDLRITWLTVNNGNNISITPPNNNRDTSPSGAANFSGVSCVDDGANKLFYVWSPIYINIPEAEIAGLILEFSWI